MGYTSHIYIKDKGLIEAPRPAELSEDEKATRERLAEEAAALGYELAAPKVEDVFKYLKEYFVVNKREFGYWFYLEATDDPYVIELCSHGENGKAYEFDTELHGFLSYLTINELMLSCTIIREGEENGDVERFVIKNSRMISNDAAVLTFPDGTTLD